MSDTLKTIQFDQDKLRSIIENSYDGIMVTDEKAKIILANTAAANYLGLTPEAMIGKTVQDLTKRGTYNHSTTLEAIEKRSVITNLVKTASSGNVISTSIPLVDQKGDIVMVLTNIRSGDLMNNYMALIEQERNKADRYKNAAAYLEKFSFPQNSPIAESSAMRKVLEKARMIANTDSTVLILGESGTGKEVISRYIHQNSARAKEPYIPVNCAAIPHELLESEFFGYERGAFSGASTRGKPGLFEIADKGTLFLDELAELPLQLQSKFLRVLETGEIQRLGATSLSRTNARLIAATNKELKQMVDEKKFREDLYYRLNVIPLTLPPLRERTEDITALAQHFLDIFNRKYHVRKYFSHHTIQMFMAYHWPGNVRELRNVVERLVITTTENELEFEAEPLCYPESAVAPNTRVFRGELKSVLQEVEKQYINQVLKECGGRITEAARQLGIHRTMLYRKIDKHCESNNSDVD